MRIAFDAKRALNNFTGLGNHARILLNAMMRDYPQNNYLLYSPKAKTELLNGLHGNFELHLPGGRQVGTAQGRSFGMTSALTQPFSILKKGSAWRSWGITSDLIKANVQVYHGISNELPFNIHRTGIKAVVTIHDLIFLKHTEQYPFIDRQFYTLKTKYAAKHAHRIIAVSEETKRELIQFYNTPAEKIEVIYPSVYVSFQKETIFNASIIAKYKLPAKYILNVGSFFPRKNHKTLIEAFALIKDTIAEDLVLLGSDGTIKKEIEDLIKARNLSSRVKIISGVSNEDLPAIYQKASLFVFPSLFEGFGAPVLEALFSKVPVIASKGGAIEEAGGPNSLFINPQNANEIAAGILQILTNESLKIKMTEQGFMHAQTMSDKVFAAKVIAVYNQAYK